jgi:ubiquinone/menaquinone biosynthesis C-methylase UbiE
MSDTFVVCAAVRGPDRDSRITAFRDLIEGLRNGQDRMNVAGNEDGVAIVRFSDASKASQAANVILEKALAASMAGQSIQPVSVSVEGGADQDVTRLTLSALKLAREVAEDNQIVIDRAVYERMSSLLERDTYGPEEEIAARRVRRRFATGMDSCFVISPIGDDGSPERQRANFVFEEYAKRACAGLNFRPSRSDQQFSVAIRRDMLASIARAKLVVAYIGGPPWNPNVMIEIGYRLAARGPIVIVRDHQRDAARDEPLPFDISDIQVLSLPARDSDANREERDRAIGDLAKAIDASLATIPDPWASHHPFMHIEMDRRGKKSTIKHATREAELLFAHKGSLAGVDTGEVIARLQGFMPDGQFKAFAVEQSELIRNLLFGDREKDRHVTAGIPIVFDGHPNEAFDQKAFLPIIVQYEDDSNENRLTLNVLYLDVTRATRIKDGTFVCGLELGEGPRGSLIWDNYAVSYDRILPRLSMYQQAVGRHVEAMSKDDVRRILDLGCGTGNVTVPLIKKNKQVTALDHSAAMLELLRQKLLQIDDAHVLILEQSAESLPFTDGRFDGVSILLALFAMDKPGQALREAIRVLKPGGTLVVTEPKEGFQMEPLLAAAKQELVDRGEFDGVEADWQRVNSVNRRIDPGLRLRLPAEQIDTILQKRGFVDIVRQESHLGNCVTISARKSA